MQDLEIFEFEGVAVRVLNRDSGPWFVAVDVCRVLEVGSTSNAVRRLDDDEKATIDTLDTIQGIADCRASQISIISEAGLYSLILTSRKPSAQRFKRWVTHEVLPSLRRTGRYALPQAAASAHYRDILPAMEDLPRLIATVEECRRLKGPEKAWALWLLLGLPDPAIDAEDDPVAMAEEWRSLREQGVGTSVIAAGAKRSPRSVQHYIAMLDKLSEEVLTALRNGVVSPYQARLLSSADPSIQGELLEAIRDGKFRTCDQLEMAIRLAGEGSD
ncbi:MAG: BRO family protein [Alphaproteobacteria bacterium]